MRSLCLAMVLASLAGPARAQTCQGLVDEITQLSRTVSYILDDFIAGVERSQTIPSAARLCGALDDVVRDGEAARRTAYKMYQRCRDIPSVCSRDDYPKTVEKQCRAMERRSAEQFSMVDKAIRLRGSVCG